MRGEYGVGADGAVAGSDGRVGVPKRIFSAAERVKRLRMERVSGGSGGGAADEEDAEGGGGGGRGGGRRRGGGGGGGAGKKWFLAHGTKDMMVSARLFQESTEKLSKFVGYGEGH